MQRPQAAPRNGLVQTTVGVLASLRARAPRVHCITNDVAQNFTANVLLATGAMPSMTLSPEEIGAFVAGAQALLVNLGTFDAKRREAASIAVATAAHKHLPWVLDPVFVDRAPARAAFALDLIRLGPSVVRLNHVEFFALSANEPSRDAIMRFAQSHRTVVALSGETDLVTDGERIAAIANGHPFMAKVTALGCAGSALLAACLAVEQDAFTAAAAALAILGVAGELAGAGATGPGSFAVGIIDALHGLNEATLVASARVS